MIWLRHPRPRVAPGICYGRLDLPEGPMAGAEIAAALKITPRAARVVSSPALRCRRLAERLAARDGAALELDERLWELDFGQWEGRAWDALDRAQTEPWAADPWRLAPPGGESFAVLHDRVAAVIAEATPGLVIVAHAGPIRAARMILEGSSVARVFAETVPYAHPIEIGEEVVRWPI